MLETRMEARTGQGELQEDDASSRFDPLNRRETPPREEENRIRAVFDLSDGVPLPRVTTAALGRYHAYLSRHLSLPFRGLYAETAYPVRHTVRYVTVTGLLPLTDKAVQGIHCEVGGNSDAPRLSLVDLGLPEDDPNYQLLDDFAYWFRNCR